MVAGSELSYDSTVTAMQMAQTIFGDGVQVVGASYTGDPLSAAIYSGGDAKSPDATPADSGLILSTGRAADFTRSGGDPNRSGANSTDTLGPNNSAAFNTLAGTRTYDASWLDADFIPSGQTLTMTFTFASEEYPEYVNSVYNDMVGIWVNGKPVDVSFGNGDVSVTNINGDTQPNLYVSNLGDTYNTEMDGFTVTMSVTFPVVPGQLNSLRVGVADVADANWDTNLLIAADSVQSTLIAHDDRGVAHIGGTTTLNPLQNDTAAAGTSLTITHVNGVPVTPGSTVVLPSGDKITLNPDMTLTFTADLDADPVTFTYTVATPGGKTDVGMITVETIPCFVAGTRILTTAGEVRIEDLVPGDLVITRDNGPQPLRWIGRRSVPAEGRFAPIRIAAGTFGAHRALMVSPLHRILIEDGRAELLFGEPEVLVAARDLVDGCRVRPVEGGMVEYVHILFDEHQVVLSEGLHTESFLPGPQMTHSFEAEMLDEICTLFPEIDPATGQGYSPAARRTLRPFEARVLIQPLHAAA